MIVMMVMMTLGMMSTSAELFERLWLFIILWPRQQLADHSFIHEMI